MFGWFKRRRSARMEGGTPLRAAAHTSLNTTEKSPHWANAPQADADAATTVQQRQSLRNRARMTMLNSAYGVGLVGQLTDDMIGTGPRLQVRSDSREAANRIERLWKEWAEEIQLAEKLQTAKTAKTVDGETFGVMETDNSLENEVKLSLNLYESEQFRSPWWTGSRSLDRQLYDGVEFNRWGRPIRYWRSKVHPHTSSAIYPLTAEDFDLIPAEFVFHMYRCDRPGQHRGISELASVLDLLVELQEYRDAAVSAARNSAAVSLAMMTDMPPGESDELEDQPLTELPLPRNSLFNLPDGWKPMVLKAEHPTTTYDMFVKSVFREIARTLKIPYAVAAGDSSEMNYASGRLDLQAYYRTLKVERRYWERRLLDRLFTEWVREARLARVLPRIESGFKHRWIWDAWGHVDPQKEALAAVTRFNMGLLDEELYWQENYGLAIDEAYEMIQATIKKRREAGLPLPQAIVTLETQSKQKAETQPKGVREATKQK